MAALIAVAALFVWARGDDPAEGPAPTPTPATAPGVTPTPTPTPTATPEAAETPPPDTHVVESEGELAIGITEPNPNFFRPDAAAGAVPPAFERWRGELLRLRPTYYRLVVDWAGLASPNGGRVALTRAAPGCMREVQPCAGYGGLRDQLQTLAALQRGDPDRWRVLVVITGTPQGLARPGTGCERAGTEPRSRPPTAAGIGAYERLIVRLLDEARASGADLRYWSPWNEPNHPYFLSPQRVRCDAAAASAATAPYVELAQAMRRALDGYPGRQELVLGETAGLLERKSSYTDVTQFIRGLPRGLACSAAAYGQHGYVGGPDPVDEVADALARFNCRRAPAVWMTETGVGSPRLGTDRASGARAQRRACRLMRKRLKRWYEDPRVTAAFQYTLREDDRFPTGLVTTDLRRAFPVLREWQAWGGEREPAGPAPKR
ncbi:MAG TPA: hypothetical protein VM266_04695, partial [Solirubrobacteraceae bacterium]|nr:hypothetical protein [Solirubrobacteraceae bacterium]